MGVMAPPTAAYCGAVFKGYRGGGGRTLLGDYGMSAEKATKATMGWCEHEYSSKTVAGGYP